MSADTATPQADPELVAPGRFGLRDSDYPSLVRLLTATGVLWIANMVANLVTAATDLHPAHPRGFQWWCAVMLGYGLLVMWLPSVLPARFVCRWYPETAMGLFVVGATASLVGFWLAGFPWSAVGSVAIAIFALLSFYLMKAWAAAIYCIVLSIGWGVLLAISPGVPGRVGMTIWVPWSMTAFAVLFGIVMADADRSRVRVNAARAELAAVNATLESRVAAQVEAISRLEELKRFLPDAVADAIVSTGNEQTLAAHRREIAVLFIDLRGFTAFTASVEPEEVIGVLSAYYEAAGAELTRFGATVGSFAGDGIFAYLGDPRPVDEPAARIIDLGLAIAARLDDLEESWRRNAYDLSYGIGLSMGHATLGSVGYDERRDYTALGTVVNRGARLCGAARGKQILVDQRIHTLAHEAYALSAIEPLTLKGFSQPIAAYEVSR